MHYIKIYGMKRSGTNVLKFLLEENFKDVFAMMNVLGWKHGPHAAEVDWAGKAWGGPTGRDKVPGIVKLVTPELMRAYEDGQVRYAIAVRHPLAMFVGQCKRWHPARDGQGRFGANRKIVRKFIKQWNENHSNWLDLVRQGSGMVVRHEDIVDNLSPTLDGIASNFGLMKCVDKYKTTKQRLVKNNDARYAKSGFRLEVEKFDPRYDKRKRYLRDLNPKAGRLIRKGLDAELLKAVGYPSL
jgi:hypothetical protein